MRRCQLAGCFLLILSFFAAVPSARAWGCKGHQAVALIAESHLTPHARQVALSILAAVPIDPALPRYCGPNNDPFADASTWPDDIRKMRPETAPWHFIDIPRGARRADIAKYCPAQEGPPGPRQREPGAKDGCVIAALTDEMRVLRNPAASPEARADALRFLIHFVGDIHQPLHADTNNDLGGNCVPVSFFGRAPTESIPGSGSFNPNLHEVWDVEILEHLSPGESSSEVTRELDQKFAARIPSWQSQPADFAGWAWESHELAETISYGRLPHPLPIERPRVMTACPNIGDPAAYNRMLKIEENLSDSYQNAAAPVVEEQIAKAGARLAALLNSLFP